MRDVKERKSRLLKYIPDVSRSVFGILDSMHKRKMEEAESGPRLSSPRKRSADTNPLKRLKSTEHEVSMIMDRVSNGDITEDTIKHHLLEAVEVNLNAGIGFDENEEALGKGSKAKLKQGRDDDDKQPLYIVPIYDELKDVHSIIRHPLFDFHPMKMTS